MSIRLLFLTAETCPTFRADVNVLFGKYLPRYGIHSDIVAGKTPGTEGSVAWGGGEAYLCDVTGGQAKKHIKTLWHGIRHLLRADRARYQAIQVRDMPVLAAIGLLVARVKRMPFYYWMSYPIPEGHIAIAQERGLAMGVMKFLFPWVVGRVGRFLLYRMVLRGADHIFVQSECMKQNMVQKGVEAKKMTPVPMGVDLESIKLDDVQPSNDTRLRGRRVIVYLGSLDRPRRIEVLFEMLAQVRQKSKNTLLALVGDTQDSVHRQWLKQQAENAGIAEHVLWTGWLPMHEGWRYVRAAEVGVSPIPRGPLLDVSSPTKVPEYFALGVPVVGNDNPDQGNILQKYGGGLCVKYTAHDFAAAILDIFNRSRDARETMLESGLLFVHEHRSYERISEHLARKYSEISPAVQER